ncbi:SAM-dependent methyltransferase [Streptomyces scopuliridis]|uniref:SAM-dependent methyltransferase n=1 Tax=Streptomyces scopuliridis TaxID=452529 RepID=A0ACD4ZX44_9ACTN|nr:SAM-dependent methyltransferase [Streptomyces scopuliridis]WSC02881.1 SAM-dependent methyltransferase [Streptomyces scopuliridis]WSC11246.1 SAM-dependent methyltransferase [Streptomyces scopuliridis]
MAAPEISATLDFTRPVALSLNALLHFVTDDSVDGDEGIVEHLKNVLPSGSTLTITHVTPDFDPDGIARLTGAHRAAGTPGQARLHAEIAQFFAVWDLLNPGVVPPQRLRPGPDDGAENITDAEAACYAGIARKP